MKTSCLIIKRVLGVLGCTFLTSVLFAQSPYDGWEEIETVLTCSDFTKAQRNEKLVALADNGNVRAMYYLATNWRNYEHPKKGSNELLKETAEKGYFMAECEMGEMYIKGQNQDSAYYWLHKAIEHTEAYINSDLIKYQKKSNNAKYKMSIEYERLATFSLAHSVLSRYYMEKEQKENGIRCAKIGYELMDKIYDGQKKFILSYYDTDKKKNSKKPTTDVYFVELFRSNWAEVVRYMAVALYITGDIKNGNKFINKYPYLNKYEVYDYVKEREPEEYLIAKCIDDCYRVYGSEHHPASLEYYRKAVEKKSYFAMIDMVKDSAIQKRIKQMAFSGDSVAAMVYLHHQLEEKDTVSVDLFLKDIPFKFSFPFKDNSVVKGDAIIEHVLSIDDVFFLLMKDALDTDVKTLLTLYDYYLYKKYKGVHDPKDLKKAVSLYEVLRSQHPNYSPTFLMKRNVSAIYYRLTDYAKAFPLMIEVCNEYPELYPVIGAILYEGYTGKPDYFKAVEYLKKEESVRNNGNIHIQYYYMGMCFLKGNGVTKDETKGFEYMKKAVECEKVVVKAYWEISKCYRFGRGVERDLKKAEYYEQEAEKAGNDDALWMRDQQYLLNILE